MLTANGKVVPTPNIVGWNAVERDGTVVLVDPNDSGVECVLDEGTTLAHVTTARAAAGGGR